MRATEILIPTMKELPSEAEIPSHQLLLKSGMIRRVAAGIYTYLPLGLRVIKKIEKIVREEMDKEGGQELLLPIIQPGDIWEESGRWEVYGEEMFKLNDRHDRGFCLGPTHEEIVTVLVRSEISSYKQMPLLLYQIQNKYRDEKRPRFGLMRSREFIMKDLYSFDQDIEGMEESYEKMYKAYSNIFRRCGLEYTVVDADSGAIGGAVSHEFMVLADTGEAEIVYCDECGYAANTEIAECSPSVVEYSGKFHKSEKDLVSTPGLKSIEEVSEYLEIPPQHMIKSLLYEADGELICVLIRGDRQINEIKLQNALDCVDLWLAPDEIIKRQNLIVGFVGPANLKGLRIIADREVSLMDFAVVGANKPDYHYIGVVPRRDFEINEEYDLRTIEEDEACPTCGSTLNKTRGIEVGQVFQLGTNYSEALNAVFTDENGKNQNIQMGCYGIGISRTMASAIEQNHDENGIIWPISIAPLHVVIIPVSSRDTEMMDIAENLYQELSEKGIEVMLDDRDESAGVKFKDADLIGYPFKIVIGKRTLKNKTVDVGNRKDSQEAAVELDKVCHYIGSLIDSEMGDLK
ncbi:MAG: proline--tRNA ligase [Clostridia bacterium]|nr:proline--tRNA ligase [Clostridia bacterium]